MKLKTLLLSSATAFVVVGGAAAAQAADLSVAEPVDYVKVCDAFGSGYWYIPGTDTCLKIGGLVQFNANFHSNTAQDWAGSSYPSAGHSASWDMGVEYHLDVTAKSMTEYGPLTAFAELRGETYQTGADNNVVSLGTSGLSNTSGNNYLFLHDAYLELGMLRAGYTESIYHYSAGYNFGWDTFDAADDLTDQVNLTWAMSGMGIQLGIEDPVDRWGTNLSSTYSMPDIVGDLTWSGKSWDAKLSGGFGETQFGSGFGAQLGATFKLDQIAPGDKLTLQGAWAQSEVSNFGADGMTPASGGSVWSAVAAFQHFWSPTLSSAVTFQYGDESGTSDPSANWNGYTIAGNLVWSPVTNFLAGVEVGYGKNSNQTDGTWGVKIRMERDW